MIIKSYSWYLQTETNIYYAYCRSEFIIIIIYILVFLAGAKGVVVIITLL